MRMEELIELEHQITIKCPKCGVYNDGRCGSFKKKLKRFKEHKELLKQSNRRTF